VFSVRLVVSFSSTSCACDHFLLQTETYQVAGGDTPTHGTDGPLKVSLVVDDCAEQFLQVGGALDPTRAQAPSDTDTNDLSTINVYTVGILTHTLSLILHLMRLLRDH
jgi:hypothetical protein